MSVNRNVQILSVEAKDVMSNKCAIVNELSELKAKELKEQGYRILRKYKGSLDYSLLTIYLKDNYKKVIQFNKDTHRFYSNDIVTVNFNYAIDNSDILEQQEYGEYSSSHIVLDILKSEKSLLNKTKNSIKGKIERLHNNIPKNSDDLFYLNYLLKMEQESQLLLDEEDIEKLKLSKNEIKKFKNKIKTVERKISEQPNKTIELEKEVDIVNDKIINIELYIEDIEKKIKIIKSKYIIPTNSLREKLYEDGFNINVNGKDTHYCRFLRSSGSARVGKINFVNSVYYDQLIEWCMAGIQYKDNNELDLPSLESYISLITSSIIDDFQLKPENVLLIDEAKSTFTDTVMATELINQVKDDKGKIISGDLHTSIQKKEITNVLHDGEALLCKSIFEEKGYSDKAVLQVRNSFYKGIGVNTDIQKFFDNNGITDISQLKGQTTAKDIKDIKLICTKSSIKYLKYGTFEEWLKIMLPTWGICKFEKDQHNYNQMANTHYQLINTLGMDFNSVKDLLKDTLEYIRLLNNDISIFKLHLGIIKDGELEEMEKDILEVLSNDEIKELDSLKTNSDFVLSMLKINEDFAKSMTCRQFRYEVVSNYIKNVKKGHVLVTGTYATVINSVYEYLQCSIGAWDGVSSTLGIGECCTAKFLKDDIILGVRSPQPTMSNMTNFTNCEAGILKEYFNVESKNVIYISAVGWNIFELESSMDVDGDQMLLTNQKGITSHVAKLDENIIIDGQEIKRFLVSTDFTPKTQLARGYNFKDLTDIDIKCSQGKIGECINLVQMLNSVYWDKKSKGASEKELLELYKDISTLNVLSCIIIDSCKKSSPVNIDGEMNNIRAKGYLGKGNITRDKKSKEVAVRPKFFKYLDGGKDYKFKWHECGMDYLIKIMSDKEINPRKDRDNENGNIQLKTLLVKNKANKADRKKIQRIIEKITHMQFQISKIHKSKDTSKDKFRQAEDIRQTSFLEISKIGLTKEMVYTIVKRLGDAYSTKDKFQEYKKIGRNILKTLYSVDPVKFLSCLQVKPNVNGTLIRAVDGDVNIYGVKYTKLIKENKAS